MKRTGPTQIVLFGKLYNLTPSEDGPGLAVAEPKPDVAGMIRRTMPEGPERDQVLARLDPAAFIAEVLADDWAEIADDERGVEFSE